MNIDILIMMVYFRVGDDVIIMDSGLSYLNDDLWEFVDIDVTICSMSYHIVITHYVHVFFFTHI